MSRATKQVAGVLALVSVPILSGSIGCSKDQFAGAAKAEVEETNIKLDLPAVPDFKMPSPYPDGTHPVAEMRLKGNKFLDTDVKVKGYIVWAYDCATALRTPDMDDKELKRILTDEPERCDRPNFYLGDAADTPVDKGVWVVEIPRAPREDEKKNLPKEEIAAWPVVPVYAIGQKVIVTGKWSLRSPTGFANSDGLLVYSALEPADPVAPPP